MKISYSLKSPIHEPLITKHGVFYKQALTVLSVDILFRFLVQECATDTSRLNDKMSSIINDG